MRFCARLLLLLASVSALTSCEAKFDWPWLNKKATTEVPSNQGGVQTQDRSVTAFDRVLLEGVGKLVFDPTIPTGTVRITADQRLLSVIRTEVTGSLLTIREDGLQGPGSWEIEFRLAPPASLQEIILGGVGTIASDSPLKTSSALSVVIQGMGKIELELEASEVKATQKGSGELVLRGKAHSVLILAQGVGRVDTSELITTTADVQSQGVGEVEVYASEKLKVRAQGLGAVNFHGHPATTDVQTEGLTKVTAAD